MSVLHYLIGALLNHVEKMVAPAWATAVNVLRTLQDACVRHSSSVLLTPVGIPQNVRIT